jgi:hypothetical protein
MGQQMTMSSVSWAKSQESENKVTFFFFFWGGDTRYADSQKGRPKAQK